MGYKDKYNLKIGQKRFIDYIIEELSCFDYIAISANKNQDLVGGKSSRMGYKDKYNLKIGQKRFIDYIIEELSCFDYIAISANKNQDLVSLKHKVIIDEIDEVGPIGGIYTAMNNINSEILFLCTCDVPNISREIVYKLYNNFDFRYDCLIPRIRGRIHPLLGIYQTKIKNIVKENIKNSDYKIRNLLDRVNTKYIDFDEKYDEIFSNINTIEEYEEYCKHKCVKKILL